MSIITFLLMLCVIAAVICGVRMAFSGQWKELAIMAVVVLCVVWVFSALGIHLPSIPTGN